MASRTETLARNLFYHYQPGLRQQHNERPSWLINPETGKALELDIFFPDIKVGIEVQGAQHGRPIKGMQRDFAAFERQQRHDMLKIELCKQQGITLYQLTSFDLTQPRFAPWYMQFCLEYGLKHDRYLGAPTELFAEAELLSRMRVVKRRYRKPGLWPFLKRILA